MGTGGGAIISSSRAQRVAGGSGGAAGRCQDSTRQGRQQAGDSKRQRRSRSRSRDRSVRVVEASRRPPGSFQAKRGAGHLRPAGQRERRGDEHATQSRRGQSGKDHSKKLPLVQRRRPGRDKGRGDKGTCGRARRQQGRARAATRRRHAAADVLYQHARMLACLPGCPVVASPPPCGQAKSQPALGRQRPAATKKCSPACHSTQGRFEGLI